LHNCRTNSTKQVTSSGKTKIPDLTLGPNDGNERTKEKSEKIAALARLHNSNRSTDRLRKNAMLAVQYRMEHYVQDDQITIDNICGIEEFVKDFLKVLGINKGAFAGFIEMDTSNLNKYYKSDRRFNTELALKIAYFFHTPADLWLKVQIKNELLLLQKEREAEEKYSKYDYEKALQIA
jgi:plasmid maintenance system antidote protein VapI